MDAADGWYERYVALSGASRPAGGPRNPGESTP